MATTPQQYIQRIDSCIGERRLRDAFVQLRALAALASDWRITEDIDRLEQTYRMMLDYAANGQSDPGRDDLYTSIVAGIRCIADRARYRIERRDSPTMYYSTLRYEALQKGDTMQGLLDRYLSLSDRHSAFNAILGRGEADKSQMPGSVSLWSGVFSCGCGSHSRCRPNFPLSLRMYLYLPPIAMISSRCSFHPCCSDSLSITTSDV